ncbi:MAG: MBL fold metallo-hydrolase [Flavobacteriales bacterium]|nr:MBL fold metallo-hydrolase [Flavobacteriales bacterium]
MKLYSINTGHFKLDGGAMFGVVPKSIWNKLNPADENNMCSWAMRCLLIEDGNRLFLIDTGIGNKQDERFFSFYYLHGNDTLDKSLAKYGFHRNDITDVFLTHLHFDHCGGVIEWDETKTDFRPAFPNAVVWTNALHWHAAINPNPREKASFLKENILPIEESGQLQFIGGPGEWMPGWYNYFVNGHTDAMMIPRIKYKNTEVIFMADLVASSHHIKIPYVMGYDIRPLDVMREKQEVLGYASANQTVLFFEHDPLIECAYVAETEKGIILKETFRLDEI